MRIRTATWSDLPRAAEVALAAFQNSAGFNSLFFPGSREFPQEVAVWWMQSLRAFWLAPRVVVIVAEAEVGDAPKVGSEGERGPPLTSPLVVGMAVWQLHGAERLLDPELEKNSWSMIFWRHFYLTIDTIHSLLHPRRALSAEGWARYNASTALLLQQHYSGHYAEHWHCWRLGTDPVWERLGAASMMARWGCERAEEEGITAGIEASDMARPVYVRAGFTEVLEDVEGPVTLKNVLRRSFKVD